MTEVNHYYLRYEYILPEPSYDFIGPFETSSAALTHRSEHGPISAEILPVTEDPDVEAPPSPLMSPQEHIERLKKRY